ncbi:crotonase/enoyl-CoA hydratase family protein [Aquimarina sp. ERC-38]|uniref:crotonase/enoyl-CoA hydratase family protein n=1 Tax=Aquimarina sp. ERC-38 TaxID=2949996 RepID=UPI0022468F9D|nr:crotonase/enoyl-CoA hydratase family protein [Aquimarina sp. ERC-38]UZO80633.1 crotonase/enoyl-CoA hydratase family protein [Aquimarina sp. ERC-38]
MKEFQCVTLDYQKEKQTLTWKIRNKGMPNFCLAGLKEFEVFSRWVQAYFSHPDRPLQFIISGSEHQGIYNLGGDLPFFLECIINRQVDRLREYAHLCINAIYHIYNGFNLPVITLAQVEGNAYGGGFECALAHDFIIANETAQLGLPENKFNLFPGMGAYSLLYRKLNHSDADMIIRSGSVYKSRFFESLGLIHEVAEEHNMISTSGNILQKLACRFNFEYHHMQCKKLVNPLQKEELLNITDIWVDACMKTNASDLRKMEILAAAQRRKLSVGLVTTQSQPHVRYETSLE